MATADLKALSDEDLMSQWTDLSESVQADKERLKEFAREHEEREQQKRFQQQIGVLNDSERQALLKYVESAPGPDSEAQAGTVGGEGDD